MIDPPLWTREQLDRWAEEAKAVGQARARLADQARAELGMEVAELMGGSA